MENTNNVKNKHLAEGLGGFLDDFATDNKKEIEDVGEKDLSRDIDVNIPSEENIVQDVLESKEQIENQQSSDNGEDDSPASFFSMDFDMFGKVDDGSDVVDDYGLGEVTYSTNEIAKELDFSTQTIRNYADYFAEFLSEERGMNGQRFFTAADFELFKRIIYLKDVKKQTKAEIKLILEGTGYTRERRNPLKTPQTPPQKQLEGEIRSNETTQLAPVKEMVTALSEQIQNKITQGMENIQNKMVEKIDESITNVNEMKKTIDRQKTLIEKQAAEIEKLKSTLGNINHDQKEAFRKLDVIANDAKASAEGTDGLKNEILSAIQDTSQQNGLNEVAEQITTNIKQNTDNKIEGLYEKVEKQSQAINKINQNVQNIKEGTQNKKNKEQNYEDIKKDINKQFISQNERIEQLISNQNKEYSSAFKTINEAIDKIGTTKPEDESVSQELEEIKSKMVQAGKTIEFLAKKNGEIGNELKTANETIKAQNEKIADLNGKIRALITAKTQYREYDVAKPVNKPVPVNQKTDKIIGTDKIENKTNNNNYNEEVDPSVTDDETINLNFKENNKKPKKGLFSKLKNK